MFLENSPINKGAKLLTKRGTGFLPYMVTSPKEELLACRKTAWLGFTLNFSPVYDVSGPDAAQLLNSVCVNRDFNRLKIGGSRHALMCNTQGQLLADGLIIRRDEKTFRTYWLAPVLAFYADTCGLDVKGQWVRDEYFFQIDGPKSLEILEAATQTDLHGLKFAQRLNVKIAGTDATVVRLGMSGCLAYEFHGDTKDAELAFETVLKAGEAFGLKRLGFNTYTKNHTPGGYPNQFIHFQYPWYSSGEALSKYVSQQRSAPETYTFFGSAADDSQNAFVTPFDVAWDYLISFDHDFIGKEALQAMAKNPPRTCVTLEWNASDVGAVFASQFMGNGVEPIDDLSTDGDGGTEAYVMSKVLEGSKVIGMTAGRARDYYRHRMLSLAFIEKDHAVEGKELRVLWGANGTHQVEIRATVAPFPYYNEEYRNETFDVEKIPHPAF